MRTFETLAAAALIASAAVALAACGGSSTGNAADDANMVEASISQAVGSATAAATPSGQDPSGSGGTSQETIRIANLYVTDTDQPGPALDVYDVPLTGQAATPILTGVAYGSFSDYVHPHLASGSSIDDVALVALPAGDDPVADASSATNIASVVDDGSHPQATIVVLRDGDGTAVPDPLDTLTGKTYFEKGDDAGSSSAVVPGQNGGPIAPAPPSGQGELLASIDVLTANNVQGHTYYLLVDGSCTSPLNGDTNEPGLPGIFAKTGAAASQFALFPTAAGTHQVSVFAATSYDTPTCAQLTPKQGTSSVTVAADQQTLVFVYGTSMTDLRLAVGPVRA